MESKPAEKIAKDQLDVTKQIAKGIREIADAGLGGAATFA
jgi:CRISPR/Cas system CSM-associated protein Csm4 (group 5 of RAMP superfamily)